MINIKDLEDLSFEKLAFRQGIYEKSDDFDVFRFEKLAFGQRNYGKMANLVISDLKSWHSVKEVMEIWQIW